MKKLLLAATLCAAFVLFAPAAFACGDIEHPVTCAAGDIEHPVSVTFTVLSVLMTLVSIP